MTSFQSLMVGIRKTTCAKHRANWRQKHRKEISGLNKTEKIELKKIEDMMKKNENRNYEKTLEKKMPGGYTNGEFPPLSFKQS